MTRRPLTDRAAWERLKGEAAGTLRAEVALVPEIARAATETRRRERAPRKAGGAARGAARRAETQLRREAVRAIARRLRIDLATLPYRGAKRTDALAAIGSALYARGLGVGERTLAADLAAIRRGL